MKKLKSSIAAKIIALILLFVFLILSAALGVAVFALAEFGAFYDGGYTVLQELGESICYYSASEIAEYYQDYVSGSTTDFQTKYF